MLDQFLCCFTQNKNGHALTFHYSSIERVLIDVRGPYVTPELNNELQCNVGNMWEKFTLYLYALKTA